MTSGSTHHYHERLWTPLRWWLLVVVFAGSIWLVYQHAYGPKISIPLAVGVFALGATGLLSYGRTPVDVDGERLRAGRATLPLWAVGSVDVLDPAAAAAARGVEADPRAYFVLRSYVPAAVRVEVNDPDDPVPYWYVSTRRPERLAAALEAAKPATA